MSDELIEILTIEDLASHPAAFIEAVRKSIDLKSMFLAQADFDGRSVGLTLDEYDEMMANLPEEVECHKCKGSGWVPSPKPRSRGVLHSSAAENCVTALYYDITGNLRPKERLPYYLRLTFEYGHALHKIVQDTFHNLAHWDTERELLKVRVSGVAWRFRGGGGIIRRMETPAGTAYLLADSNDSASPLREYSNKVAYALSSYQFEALPTTIDDLLKDKPQLLEPEEDEPAETAAEETEEPPTAMEEPSDE